MSVKKFLMTAALTVVCATAFAGPKVGLIQLVEHPSLDEIRTALEARLKAEIPDVEIDYQNGQNNPSTINSIAQKFVGSKVDAIVAIATPAAQGALAATSDIPVIFAAVTDPVAAGLTGNLEHPDGNATGTSDLIPVDRIFDLASKVTPGVKSYGIIYNPGEVNSATVVESAKAVLDKAGLKHQEVTVTSSAEVTSAVQSLLGKVDALFVPIDNTVASAMVNLSELAKEHKTPVYAAADSLVRDGALATVGINYTRLGDVTGEMTAKVLKGTPVADLPVAVMKDFDQVFNDETAAALGIDLTPFKSKK